MKTAFVILGIVLIVLFLAWIVLARPERDRRRTAIGLDIALIMVSAAVLTVGFLMRDRHMADIAAARQLQEGDVLPGGHGQPDSDASAEESKESGTQGDRDYPSASQDPEEPGNASGTGDGGSQGAGGMTGSGNQGSQGSSQRPETAESQEAESTDNREGEGQEPGNPGGQGSPAGEHGE